MPRIALLSDIHANLHALEAVLAEIAGTDIDGIVFLGDIVGYGPFPAECVKIVRESGGTCVLGNHDEFTIAAHRQPDFIPSTAEARSNPVWAGILHAVKCLDDDAIEWLESLPLFEDVPGGLVAHAALHDSEPWPYLLDADDALPTLEILADCRPHIGFFGHTHRQEWFSLPGKPQPERLAEGRFHVPDDCVCAVVVGSVGQPRTGDNRAAWTLWDSDARTFEFRRTAYPFRKTAKAIHEAGLPESSARRLM